MMTTSAMRDGVFWGGFRRTIKRGQIFDTFHSWSYTKQEEHLNFQTLKDPFVSLEEFEQIDTIIFNSMFIII